jgi:hypothetical protein
VEACCVPPALILPTKPAVDRRLLIREVFGLEWLTISWMIIEAMVATAAGVALGSLVLIAFGLDSVVELISAVCFCGVCQSSFVTDTPSRRTRNGPCDTEAMNLHLAEIAKTVTPDGHAVLLVDQAG